MIGEYERDEIFRSRLGNHPRIWSPNENQVRYMVRKCRETEKGFNVECDDQEEGTCPFCCVDGCRRLRCNYGLADKKRAEWQKQLEEMRPDDIRQNFLTTNDEFYGCDPQTRICQEIRHAKGRPCPKSPTAGIDRDNRPKQPNPRVRYNPDHVLPSQPPSIYTKASETNRCHRLSREWSKRPYALSEVDYRQLAPLAPHECNGCCANCENLRVGISEKYRSSRPTVPPGYPPPCRSAPSSLPPIECPRVRIRDASAIPRVEGKWPGTFGDIPAKFLGQIKDDRKACLHPNPRTYWVCPYHQSLQFPLEKANQLKNDK